MKAIFTGAARNSGFVVKRADDKRFFGLDSQRQACSALYGMAESGRAAFGCGTGSKTFRQYGKQHNYPYSPSRSAGEEPPLGERDHGASRRTDMSAAPARHAPAMIAVPSTGPISIPAGLRDELPIISSSKQSRSAEGGTAQKVSARRLRQSQNKGERPSSLCACDAL
jgi:hypothetical protein